MLQNNLETILPIIYLLTVIFIILIYGTLYSASGKNKYPILTKSIGYLSIQSLGIALALNINNATNGKKSETVLNNVIIIDDFTTFIGTLVIIGAIATILITLEYTKKQYMSARINEYMVLILFSTLSMILLVTSFDLISMYLAIELQSLSFYVLAAYQRNSEYSTEAGLKYFILGALTSGVLLFGESIVYGFTGLTNFEELTKIGTTENIDIMGMLNGNEITATTITLIGTWIGVFFILIAFLFKISAVPFHLWTPDVYEGAPTTVTAFFSITPKIAILGLLVRLCMFTFYDFIEAWEYVIVTCAFLSMFIGTLGAINQNKIKRLLAYSSIAHVGYILISLATGTIESIEALLIYAVLYMLTVIGAFSVILVMAQEKGQTKTNLPTINYELTNSYIYKSHLKQGNTYITNEQNTKTGTKTEESNQQEMKLSYASLIQGNPIWDSYYALATIMKPTNNQPSPKETKYNLNKWIEKTLLKPIEMISKNLKKKEEAECRSNSTKIYKKHITDFSALAKTNPILALTAAMIFFSNAGIPPLAGFYGKLNVFLTAIENSMYFLAIAGILCSVIGTFYSIRLVKIIYYHSMTTKNWNFYQNISKENAIILALSFFFTCFFCLSPSFLFITAHSAAISLCI